MAKNTKSNKNKKIKQNSQNIKTNANKQKVYKTTDKNVDLDLEKIKNILIQKKNEIIEEIKMQSQYENLNEKDVGDEIDDVVQTVEKELKFDISATEKNILNEIEVALKKIENGKYGICELCKKPIEPKRLKAIPYSRYCIDCQKKHQNI